MKETKCSDFAPGSATFENGEVREVSAEDTALIRALMARRFWTKADAYRFVLAGREAKGATTKGDFLLLQDELTHDEQVALVGSVLHVAEIVVGIQVYDAGSQDCFG
jgi:hypothetical protein